MRKGVLISGLLWLLVAGLALSGCSREPTLSKQEILDTRFADPDSSATVIIGDLTLTIPREDLVHYEWTTLEKLSPDEPARLERLEIPWAVVAGEEDTANLLRPFISLSSVSYAHSKGTLAGVHQGRLPDAGYKLFKAGEEAGFEIFRHRPLGIDAIYYCEKCQFFGSPIAVRVEREDFVDPRENNHGRRISAYLPVSEGVIMLMRTHSAYTTLEEMPDLYRAIERKLIEYGAPAILETD